MKNLIKDAANRIFIRLDEDISDRFGIKDAWGSVPQENMEEFIKPEWRRIIEEELRKFLNEYES